MKFLLTVSADFMLACLSSWIIVFRDGRAFFLAMLTGSGRCVQDWLSKVRGPWVRLRHLLLGVTLLPGRPLRRPCPAIASLRPF